MAGPWVVGEPHGGKGKDSKLRKAIEIVENGGGLEAIADEVPEAIVRYHRGIDRLLAIRRKRAKLECTPFVCTLYGDTGWGKSEKAVETAIRS